jgi:hypothetical protein
VDHRAPGGVSFDDYCYYIWEKCHMLGWPEWKIRSFPAFEHWWRPSRPFGLSKDKQAGRARHMQRARPADFTMASLGYKRQPQHGRRRASGYSDEAKSYCTEISGAP